MRSKSDVLEPLGMPADLVSALPVLIAQVYEQAQQPLRAQLLECLLQPLGPLALVAVASGAFSTFVHRQGWQRLNVPVDGALEFSAEQLQELAGFALEIDPGVLVRLDSLLTDRPRPAPALDALVADGLPH
jgi:hypothetical protein